ncbi:ubiquitin carboxyl-terminal hydrolase [Mortierella sp. NVP41]|nr:ubiquitin carboxyl-terminal hydrolase [Mortierella sp. NVP41]
MWRNGINGAYIQELYSLDRPTFRQLARQPVYGFIFLITPQGSRLSKALSTAHNSDCSNVYFAQQVIPDACGTQAILSVALNSQEEEDGLDIGSLLRNFKDFTTGFSPLNKGLTMTNCIQLRENHNSSAGQYERRLPDLPLSFFPPLSHTDASATVTALSQDTKAGSLTGGYSNKPNNKHHTDNICHDQEMPKKRKRRAGRNGTDHRELSPPRPPPQPPAFGNTPKKDPAKPISATDDDDDEDDDDEDDGDEDDDDDDDDDDKTIKEDDYHYIAYVHVDGYIWELDGLQPEPIRLAACTRDQWVSQARLEFKARVLSFGEEEQSFVLMAMVKDPIMAMSQRICSLRDDIRSSTHQEQREQQEQEFQTLEDTLLREEEDREAEKSAIQEMEADYRPAVEFFMKALETLDQHNGMHLQ